MNRPPELSEAHLEGYRQRLSETLEAIGRYAGSEDAYQHVWNLMIRLDQWLTSIAGYAEGSSISSELEEYIAHRANGPNAEIIRVSSMLERLQERFSVLLSTTESPEEIARMLGILYERRGNVLVPTNGEGPQAGNGDGEWNTSRFTPRIQSLIAELQRHGIFVNDLIMRDGIRMPGMMRQASYTSIEIPSLNWDNEGGREIVACNYTGEAARVSIIPQGIEAYENLRKSDLDQLSGIRKITGMSLEQWTRDAIEDLLGDTWIPSRNHPHYGRRIIVPRKIDVRSLETARREICLQFSAEEWLNLAPEQLYEVMIGDQSFIDIAHQLTPTKMRNEREMQVHWAQLVYGLGNNQARSAVGEYRHFPLYVHVPFENPRRDWRDRILEDFPTSQDWLTVADPRSRSPMRERLHQLLYALGFDLILLQKEYELLLMGAKIYGENDEFIRQAILNCRTTFGLEFYPWSGKTADEEIRIAEVSQERGLISIRALLRLQRSWERKWERNLEASDEQIEQINVMIENYLQRYEDEHGMDTNLPTPLTPLINIPELELTEAEGTFFQILLNDREYIDKVDFTRILDPFSQDQSSDRDTITHIVAALDRKLRQRRVGSINKWHDRYLFVETSR